MPRTTTRSEETTPTPSEGEVLRLYLQEIGKHSLLSKADEQRLGRIIEAGRNAAATLDNDGSLSDDRRAELCALVAAGERATETFVSANLRLVVSMAKR